MQLALDDEAQDFTRETLDVLVDEIHLRAVIDRIVGKLRNILGAQRELVAGRMGSHQ